jgi:hypothetical protein
MRRIPVCLLTGFAGAGSKHLRVVRGGAFNNTSRNVRCAYRNRNNPDNRNDNIGFRVVLSTLFDCRKCRAGRRSLSGRGEEWRSPFLAALGFEPGPGI